MVDVFPVVAPPTAVVFLWGVFWKKTSSRGALWTLVGGSIVGLIIYTFKLLDSFGVIELSNVHPQLDAFITMNGLFMAFILFVAESVFIFGVSLARPHQHTAESEKLVWDSPLEALRSKGAWRGLLDYRVLAVLLVVTMVALYWAFSSSVTYYPVAGQVTLDGKPVVGALVILETDDDRLDARLSTGTDGKFEFATPKRAGGAPDGTKYRVRVVPNHDFIVRMKEDQPGEVEEVLDWMPAGTPVEEKIDGDKRKFLIGSGDKQRDGPEVDKDANVTVLRATAVPEKYQSEDSPVLAFSVGPEKTSYDLKLN
jgi:hypothetical protein